MAIGLLVFVVRYASSFDLEIHSFQKSMTTLIKLDAQGLLHNLMWSRGMNIQGFGFVSYKESRMVEGTLNLKYLGTKLLANSGIKDFK